MVHLELEPAGWPGPLLEAELARHQLNNVSRGQTLYLGGNQGRLYAGDNQLGESELALSA
ncbi:hypothetical protein MBH78_06175 [Oceanimonas sp. NS1]|nr:hypothetical protein [Oceanimonas sp. NS1]